MSIGLWIKGNKYEFNGDFGWYRSNEFVLFSVKLLEFLEDRMDTIFNIQIAKFSVGLYVSRIN